MPRDIPDLGILGRRKFTETTKLSKIDQRADTACSLPEVTAGSADSDVWSQADQKTRAEGDKRRVGLDQAFISTLEGVQFTSD